MQQPLQLISRSNLSINHQLTQIEFSIVCSLVFCMAMALFPVVVVLGMHLMGIFQFVEPQIEHATAIAVSFKV